MCCMRLEWHFALVVLLCIAPIACGEGACDRGYELGSDGTCQVVKVPTCPPGSLFHDGQCRKIVCPFGELYNDACLQVLCPSGLVWRAKKCQEPGYFTTILEIENIVTNEEREKAVYYDHIHGGSLALRASPTKPPRLVAAPTSVRPTSSTRDADYNHIRGGSLAPPTPPTKPNHLVAAPTSVRPTLGRRDSDAIDSHCCTVRSARICKRYNQRWICFNRNHRQCDPDVCTSPVVYLRAPAAKFVAPFLVTPPRPPGSECDREDCQRDDSAEPDCSGCTPDRPGKCSDYCHLYMCPGGMCNFMDLDVYCSRYRGQFGCVPEDGCLWDWC